MRDSFEGDVSEYDEGAFMAKIMNIFVEVVNAKPEDVEKTQWKGIIVESLKRGGRSSGVVSSWWQYSGMEILRTRFKQMKSPADGELELLDIYFENRFKG